MINTSELYENYVVFVESKSLRGRSKQEFLWRWKNEPLEPRELIHR